MLVLVSGANYFVMFVGWEGIGVKTYYTSTEIYKLFFVIFVIPLKLKEVNKKKS